MSCLILYATCSDSRILRVNLCAGEDTGLNNDFYSVLHGLLMPDAERFSRIAEPSKTGRMRGDIVLAQLSRDCSDSDCGGGQ